MWQYVASLSILSHTKHLSDLSPCLDERGEPICFAGSAALVCKVERNGTPKVLRTYMNHRRNLREIYGENFYPLELPVLNPLSGVIDYADVVLTDWCEGVSLQRVLEQRYKDSDYILRLSQSFERFALRLLDEEWAHGDIKPDNIIVNGEDICLIDYDATYLPSFKRSDCEEIGSLEYQHPTRSSLNFSKSIDDYPLALIMTALRAIAYDASLGELLHRNDYLLISPLKAVCGDDEVLSRVESLFVERGDARYFRIAQLLRSVHLALPRLREFMTFVPKRATSVERLEIAAHGGLWGYKEGDEWIIPPLYDLAFDVEDGVCQVVLNGRTLYLNGEGEIINNE